MRFIHKISCMRSFAFGFIYKTPMCIGRSDTIVLVEWPEKVLQEVLEVVIINEHLSWRSGACKVALKEYDFLVVGQHCIPAYNSQPFMLLGYLSVAIFGLLNCSFDSVDFTTKFLFGFFIWVDEAITVVLYHLSNFTFMDIN